MAIDVETQARYQERAARLYKLLDGYLDKRHLPTGHRSITQQTGLLHLPIRQESQKMIATLLREVLHCKVVDGKDRFGRTNGYLVVSLDTDRLHATGVYQAALALERLERIGDVGTIQ